MNAQQPLEQRFEDLIARIDEAIRQVDSGALADFEALNREIMDVFAATQGSSKDVAQSMQNSMGKVIMKLDELASSITAYKNTLQGKEE
jgi:BMFP domain-containing protein YqiC